MNPPVDLFRNSTFFDDISFMSVFQAVANAANVHAQDLEAPPEGVDDMTKLAYLHEPGVLYNLKCRYNMNEIYVSTFLMDLMLCLFSSYRTMRLKKRGLSVDLYR